jgi:hypothetical protein
MNPDEVVDQNISVSRLATKKQSLDDMYSVPANFLEIDVINPQTTVIGGKKKYTDYEVRMRVSCKNTQQESKSLEEKKKTFPTLFLLLFFIVHMIRLVMRIMISIFHNSIITISHILVYICV